MPSKADLLVDLEFLTSEEDGRNGPTPRDCFRCAFEFEGEFFDCRLDLRESGSLAPGSRARVALRFLRTEMIVPRLLPGAVFTLWEMRTIARGRVVEVLVPAS
jgi:hypothetical protein